MEAQCEDAEASSPGSDLRVGITLCLGLEFASMVAPNVVVT